jgi:hypothetical protein
MKLPNVLIALVTSVLAVATAGGEPRLDDDNSWAFKPGDDAFTQDALLDLRYLNEIESGKTGFIRLSEDGSGFVRGDSEPIRFWSVIIRVDLGAAGFSREEVEQAYRFMAKRGVNMARVFLMIPDGSEGSGITDIDEAQIDRLHQHIAAAKANGIYVTISPYWPFEGVPESWGLDGVPPGTQPWGLLFFNDKFQNAYKGWLREIYTRVNPYTGLAVVDDPTVAILLSLNEDSLLFWTFDNVPPAQKQQLSQAFGDRLIEEYGSLDAARDAWDGFTLDGDDFDAGRPAFLLTYEFTVEPRVNPTRRRDQLRFLAETQRRFFGEVRDFVRDDLGAEQLVSDTNWRPADLARQNDLERWTYTGSDVVALNRFFTGLHNGPNNGWRIDPGDRYTNASALRQPHAMPVAVKQPVAKPFILTETAWVSPTLYQSEGPIVSAAYMGLTGVDAMFWFPIRTPQWQNDPRHVGATHFKWHGRVPYQAGQFPAAALLHRLRLVDPAPEPAVVERRSLDSLFHGKVAAITEGTPFDPNRDFNREAAGGMQTQRISPLAFFVGPVLADYGAESDSVEMIDLERFIDDERGTVRSMTGQLTLDSKVGLFVLNAPAAQGVAGFLDDAGGRFELDDVTIESANHYASITAVATDARPLATSERILIQVGTFARLDGWTALHDPDAAASDAERAAGEDLLVVRDVGTPPWRVANTQATLTIRNSNVTRVTALDANGYATSTHQVVRDGDRLSLELPPDAMYVLLDRAP